MPTSNGDRPAEESAAGVVQFSPRYSRLVAYSSPLRLVTPGDGYSSTSCARSEAYSGRDRCKTLLVSATVSPRARPTSRAGVDAGALTAYTGGFLSRSTALISSLLGGGVSV